MVTSDSTFVIAEAGVNHNGSRDLALGLVEAAAIAGADAIKFQTFTAEKLVRRGAEKAEYQKRGTGDGDQFEMLKKLEMSPSLHNELVQRCAELNIEFMSTPFDCEAADFLLSLGMKRIKVPSGEITNIPYLEFLAGKGVPMIISTGMASLSEVQEAVAVVKRVWSEIGRDPLENLTLLHCTSNYPAAFDDVNLRAMRTMQEATGLAVGYSDHTSGISVSIAAVALGATVIEKHFTLDKSLPGPDHNASLDTVELAAMIRGVREVERSLGASIKEPTASEEPIRSLVRRSVTLAVPLSKGDVVSRECLVLLRPGTGIAPKDVENVIGRRAIRNLEAGTTLTWNDLV